MQQLKLLVAVVVIALLAGTALLAAPAFATDAGVAETAGSAGAASVAEPAAGGSGNFQLKVDTAHHGNGDNGGAVAIVVPIAFFTLVAMLVFLPLFLRNRRRALDAQVQAKAIEAGMQYVPALPAPPLKRRNDRRTGALLAGVGVALAVPLALIGQTHVAVFGLAPVLLGVVYFLVGTLLPSPSQQ